MNTPKTTDAPIHIESSDQLDELTADSAAVLVDYHVDWCGPCRMFEPTVRGIARETDAVVTKVDTDELRELARKQRIRSVPTPQFYAGDEQVKGIVGVRNKEDLVDTIEAAA